ncbi:MAG: hypothetical protein EHM39_10675, partial [Chloroflexi bacterium]
MKSKQTLMARLFIAVFMAAMLWTVSSVAQTAVRVIATVNGEAITTAAVERELVRIHTLQTHDTSRADFSVERLLQKLINDKLLAQEAREIGIPEDSAVAARVSKFRSQRALRVMLQEALPDTFTVPETELRAEYYKRCRRYEIRMVSVKDSLLAIALADSIRQGVPMDRLASTHSMDRYKDKGGLAGSFKTIDMPEILRDTLVNGHPGDLLGPANLWRVFCLIRPEQHLDPDTSVTFEDARSLIEGELKAIKRKEASRLFYERLYTAGQVTVDSVLVDSVLIRMIQGLPGTDAVVARVGSSRILTDNDVRNKLIHKSVGRIDRESKMLLAKVLFEQLENLLLQEAAARNNYDQHPQVAEAVRAYEDSLIAIRYLEDVVNSKVEVTDPEIETFYRENPDRFHERSRYKIATLTRDLLEEIEEDYRMLLTGADFGWLARQHSTDSFKERGGERDWLSVDKLPTDAATLDSLQIGEVTPPVETEDGYALIKLVDVEQGPLLPLERVSNRIYNHLHRIKSLQAIDETLKQLRDNSTFAINEDVLQELTISG